MRAWAVNCKTARVLVLVYRVYIYRMADSPPRGCVRPPESWLQIPPRRPPPARAPRAANVGRPRTGRKHRSTPPGRAGGRGHRTSQSAPQTPTPLRKSPIIHLQISSFQKQANPTHAHTHRRRNFDSRSAWATSMPRTHASDRYIL